jgi:RES domain-containing protein
MLSVWQITTAAFARSAFSGEGARLYGGRWNPKGEPIVYTAASQSLAMLEMLVQDQPLRARYMMIEARIPAALSIDRVRIDHLPSRTIFSSRCILTSSVSRSASKLSSKPTCG